MVTAVPLATRREGRRVYPNEAVLPAGAGGLDRASIAMALQVRTVSKRRLARRIGRLEDRELGEGLRQALRIQLDL